MLTECFYIIYTTFMPLKTSCYQYVTRIMNELDVL